MCTPRRSHSTCVAVKIFTGVLFFGTCIGLPAHGQRPTKQAADSKQPAGPGAAQKPAEAKPAGQKEEDKYQIVSLQTDDGVLINATYFPSKSGKESPAVILLHGYGERQRVYDDLAFDLQERGFAVITLDFRGHGRSTQWANAGAAEKNPANARKLDFHDFRAAPQFVLMMYDIEAAKRYLVRRNNAGELNVSRLGVVGIEMGASLGVLWSFRDWQYTSTVAFVGKQGQDVQSIVLISPHYNYKGLAITQELSYLFQRLPIQFVAGKKDSKAFNEAEKMQKSAVKAMPRADVPSELVEVDTKLQGSKLLDPDLELDVNKSIVKFLDASLRRKGTPWAMREVSDSDSSSGR